MEQYKQEFIRFMVDSDVLKFGEFTLEEEQTERDEDGDTKTSYVAVFSGLMVVCQHNLDLQDDFSISQYTTYIGGNAIRTESEAFNKAFSVPKVGSAAPQLPDIAEAGKK